MNHPIKATVLFLHPKRIGRLASPCRFSSWGLGHIHRNEQEGNDVTWVPSTPFSIWEAELHWLISLVENFTNFTRRETKKTCALKGRLWLEETPGWSFRSWGDQGIISPPMDQGSSDPMMVSILSMKMLERIFHMKHSENGENFTKWMCIYIYIYYTCIYTYVYT